MRFFRRKTLEEKLGEAILAELRARASDPKLFEREGVVRAKHWNVSFSPGSNILDVELHL